MSQPFQCDPLALEDIFMLHSGLILHVDMHIEIILEFQRKTDLF